MVITKRFTKEAIILFLFFALLPFGQILRVPVSFFDANFYLNAADIIAIVSLITVIISKVKYPVFWKSVLDFKFVVFFSLFFSLSLFEISQIIVGAFYFIRLVSYFSLFLVLWNLFKRYKNFKDTVFKSFMVSSIFIAVFGWIQYFVYPDVRALYYFDWDDHLLRMVGGFLDPTFTGLFLVLGIIFSTLLFLREGKKSLLVLSFFLMISLAFTYSRASYLALGFGFLGISLIEKKFKEVILLGALFILVVLLLPVGGSEGVNLMRVTSIFQKTQNYKDSANLIKLSPVFGIGFNNVCLGKEMFLGEENIKSHACSGLDSSILFLIATTGMAGLFSFINLVSVLIKNVKNDIYGKAFIVCGIVLIVHSLFANSLFYSWVLGLMAILLALAT